MDDDHKAAIADGFKKLPNVKDATVYNPGEAHEMGNIPMATVKLDFSDGSTHLIVSEHVLTTFEPAQVAEFYSDVVTEYAERNSLTTA